MLLRMYLKWADAHGIKTEIIDQSDGEVAGIKGATVSMAGDYAYGWLRTETGVHRLVRKSPFDSGNRRHTSFASVFVSPEVDDDIDIEINPADLRTDVYRSSGAGGQHVNKTESAVRITHVPTGIVVACQSERSQHKNRSTAMKMLKAKLYELEFNKRNAAAKVLEDSKSDVSWGNQIRSYVLDQSRIKDLRTGVEIGNTAAVLDGDLDRVHASQSEAGPMNENEPPSDENHLIAERRAKLAKLRERGIAFPNDFRRDALAARSAARRTASGAPMALEAESDARAASPAACAPSASWARRASPKSRIAAARSSCFCRQQTLGAAYEDFKGWDVGDIVGAEGALFRTRTGELSVRVDRLVLLTKSLRPLPDKWHGIADTEMRYRRRYVDLIMNEDTPAGVPDALADRALPARLPRRARLSRGGDADAAAHPGRRRGAALQDAPQCARPGHVPAHRPGAVSEAARPSAASSASTRSTAISATRASRRSTIPNSRCSSCTRPTPTTAISWR